MRLWHWLLAIAVLTALVTGWIGDLDLMNIHMLAGSAVVALLVFRVIWALCGGTYARFRHYWTTPQKVFNHFRGLGSDNAHTAPGIALTICVLIAIAVQSFAGLFTTDDIFIDGPFVKYVPSEIVDFAGYLHHRAWWFVAGLISIHLLAHIVYGFVLRSKVPLSMFTGNKPGSFEPTEYSAKRALVAWTLAAIVYGLIVWFID